MEIANRLKGTSEYYFSKKLREIEHLRAEGKTIINLGIGSPDMPPHPEVIDELCKHTTVKNAHGYQSYKGIPQFREAVAGWYKKYFDTELDSNEEILPLIGSKEGIMHICMTYLNKGDKVLIPNPGYPTYKSAVHLASGECIDYELTEENEYLPNWEKLENIEKGSIKLMFVNYPHMPTGAKASKEALLKMVDFARRKNILLVNDNPYSFILNTESLSIMSIEGAKEVAIELNSLSKSHNMAGWRIGCMISDKRKIDEVLCFKSNMDSGMFLPVQMAAAKALTLDESWYLGINAEYQKRKDIAIEIMETLGCELKTPQVGMFLWGKIPTFYKDTFELCDKILYEKNVFLTPGGIFGNQGNRYLRISLCSSVEVLKSALENIKAKKVEECKTENE